MDYITFCKNADGSWNRPKEYQWHYEHVNAEYASGVYGEYSSLIAKGYYTELTTALLWECGVKSEGIMTPLVTKKIFSEPLDKKYVYGEVKNHVSRDDFQNLLTKYGKIIAEFTKRYENHQAETEKKYGIGSKPQLQEKNFK